MSDSAFHLHRVFSTPILEPRPHLAWERGAMLNSAVWEEAGKTFLFYRAVDHDPAWTQQNPVGEKYNTSVGLAISDDGVHFERQDEPLIPWGFLGLFFIFAGIPDVI